MYTDDTSNQTFVYFYSRFYGFNKKMLILSASANNFLYSPVLPLPLCKLPIVNIKILKLSKMLINLLLFNVPFSGTETCARARAHTHTCNTPTYLPTHTQRIKIKKFLTRPQRYMYTGEMDAPLREETHVQTNRDAQ